MLSETDRKRAVELLSGAEKTCKQIPQLTKTWPDMTIEDA